MKQKLRRILLICPLVFGTLSVFTFGLYYYSANHPPYRYINVIVYSPIFAIAGFILSILTRKDRKEQPVIWYGGMVICTIGFVISLFVLIVLAMIVAAMMSGNWL